MAAAALAESGRGVGVDVYVIRHSEAPWFDGGLEVKKTGERQSGWPPCIIISAWKEGT